MNTSFHLTIPRDVMAQIQRHGEQAYPEEGAGVLLGIQDGEQRSVRQIITLDNAREMSARHNRYLITPQDMLMSENEAARLGLDVVGVFHSHPDHPNRPSEFDLEWALPWYSYIITSIHQGKSAGSRSWRLSDDRQRFDEELISLE